MNAIILNYIIRDNIRTADTYIIGIADAETSYKIIDKLLGIEHLTMKNLCKGLKDLGLYIPGKLLYMANNYPDLEFDGSIYSVENIPVIKL